MQWEGNSLLMNRYTDFQKQQHYVNLDPVRVYTLVQLLRAQGELAGSLRRERVPRKE